MRVEVGRFGQKRQLLKPVSVRSLFIFSTYTTDMCVRACPEMRHYRHTKGYALYLIDNGAVCRSWEPSSNSSLILCEGYLFPQRWEH